MTGFWISALAMVAMAALLIVQAVLRARAAAIVPDGTADLAVYRDQLAEIDRDMARGLLAPGETERLRVEVQRRMLGADRQQSHDKTPRRGSLGLAIGAVVLCLAGAAGLYTSLGVPGYPDLPLQMRLAAADQAYQDRPLQDMAEAAQPPFVQPTDIDPNLAAMLDKLRAAVAIRPGDLVGHSLLAQNEAALGNFVAARKAQAEVVDIKGDQATGRGFVAAGASHDFGRRGHRDTGGRKGPDPHPGG